MITEATPACASVIILPRLTLCLVKCVLLSGFPCSCVTEYPSPEVCLFTFLSMSSLCVSCFILIVPGSVCVTLGFGFLGSLVDCVPQVFSLRPYLISGFLCSLSCPYTQAVLCVLLFLLFMPEFWVSCILKLLFQGCCWVVAQQPRITSMTISAFELVYL